MSFCLCDIQNMREASLTTLINMTKGRVFLGGHPEVLVNYLIGTLRIGATSKVSDNYTVKHLERASLMTDGGLDISKCDIIEKGKTKKDNKRRQPDFDGDVKSVTRPGYYETLDPTPLMVIKNWKLSFCLGNAIKYIARAGKKEDAKKDLLKAKEYIDLEIENLEKDTLNSSLSNICQLHIGKYTATCQEVNGNIAIFCMDQYLDEPMKMNGKTYETSELRKRINSEEVLSLFPEEIRFNMVPFENGDLVRIPYAEELFSSDDIWFDMEECSGKKQWPLMKDRKNKICLRNNEYEWGWLMNKTFVVHFANIDGNGFAHSNSEANSAGVRLVFQIRKDDENGKNKRSYN